MARSPNCTGAPLFKGRVDVTITYPDPYEPPLLDPPEALPTSEPATAQIEITITSAMLPTWSPFELPHSKLAMLYAGGANTTGSDITLNYRLSKNGESLATGGQPASANQQWTMNIIPGMLIGVAVGDVLQFKMWGGSAGLTWNYRALAVVPTRVGPKDIAVANVAFGVALYPVLTKGNPYTSATNPLIICTEDYYLSPTTERLAAQILVPGSTYRLCRVWFGEVNSAIQMVCHATYKPHYYRHKVPSRLSYTPLNLRV